MPMVRCGGVCGARDHGVLAFRGVPFARSPGARRFMPPGDVTPWADVLPCRSYGPAAPQRSAPARDHVAPEDQAEDCLTLNVWSPGTRGQRPVLVWIHGGGFLEGSGALSGRGGAAFSAHADVVVVTLNYRLGVLGFAAHERLRDPQTGHCGNWGHFDQIAALRWVRDNIAAFGGDASAVTLGGHSAGAISVCNLMASPAAASLFDRVIVLSGAPAAVALSDLSKMVEWCVTQGGMDSVGDLRRAPVEQILDLQGKLSAAGRTFAFRPCVDGVLLADHPLDTLASGAVPSPPPLLIGSAHQETRFFYEGSDYLERMTPATLLRRASRLAGGVAGRAETIVAAYAEALEKDAEPCRPGDIWAALESDHGIRAPAMLVADSYSRRQPETYVYYLRPEKTGVRSRHVHHGAEADALFGPLPGSPPLPMLEGVRIQLRHACTAWVHGESPGWASYCENRAVSHIAGKSAVTKSESEDPVWLAWTRQELRQ